MFTDQIDKLKREYTDKYVLVDASRPELARFRDVVGRVKTVNMSGRALVEFDDYHLNIGWYDIAPEYLKVVAKPPPKVEKPKAEAKPPAAKPAAAAKAPAAKSAAKPAAAKAPATAAPGKMSVADMLAAARGGGTSGATPAAKSPAVAKPSAKVQADAAPVEEIPALEERPVAKPPAESTSAKPAAGNIDRTKMSVAEMLAYARQSDKKS